MEKKKRLISIDKLPVEIQTEFQKRYSHGYRRYVQKITNHKNEIFYCVPVETEDSLWMIKINTNKSSGDFIPHSFPELDDDDNDDDDIGRDDSDIEIPETED